MSNTKYVRLSQDRSHWTSALFNVKPRPIRRHPDEIIHQYDWFVVEEHKQPLPDKDLYRHERESWELKDNIVHITYRPALIDLERRREIMSARCTELRNQKLRGGLTFSGMPFDTRPETYHRVLGVVIKASADPEFTTLWINQDNKRVLLDAQSIAAFGDAYAQFEQEHIMHCRDMKDTIEASDSPEEIDIHEGWPEANYFPDLGLSPQETA